MVDTLPPFAPEWLQAEEMMGGRIVMPAEPIEQCRERFRGIFAGVKPLLPPPTDAVKTKDVEYSPGRKVRIYVPADGDGGLAVGLYVHSGGWCSGDIEQEDSLCRGISEMRGMILYSPEYRLAPEDPYPAGLKDVCAAYEFMHNTADEHGWTPNRKFIRGGSSSSGLLANFKTTQADKFPPAEPLMMNVFPVDRYEPELYADSPMIGNDLVRQARLWNQAPPDDGLVSPLLHPDIKFLPPVYVAACTKDPTHPETVFFYEDCKKQGVNAELVEWVGWPHFFWILPMLPKPAEFMEVWCQKLRKMIATQ